VPRSVNPIDAAAADVKRHLASGGGWALGLAVAACVNPGTGNGDPLARTRNDRNSLPKVSMREFADKASTSAPRISRYLAAWQKAADAGLVAQPDTLSPQDWDDIDHLPKDADWEAIYDASKSGGRPRDSRAEDAAVIIERRGAGEVIDALTDEQVEDVVRAAHNRRPRAARRGTPLDHDLPTPAFPRPPHVPGNEGGWMEADRDVANLHDAVLRIRRIQRAHPDLIADLRLNSIAADRDMLAMIIEVANGVTDDDLIALLDGAS
jgi:hypothetical protein